MCMRAKKDDIGFKHFFLVAIYEPSEYWDDMNNEIHSCKECGREYTRIEKAKQHDNKYSGSIDFCCADHSVTYSERNKEVNLEIGGKYSGVIYKITNKKTGKSYMGQTTQYFTYRWFQHFKSNSTKKFGSAIKNSELTDWVFEVVEVVTKDQKNENKNILDELELAHIIKNNCIDDGYNTSMPALNK